MSRAFGTGTTTPGRRAFDTSDVVLFTIITVAAASPFPGSGDLLIALSAAALLTGWPRKLGLWAHPFLGLFFAWAAVSLWWSDARFLTVRGLAIYGGVSIAVWASTWRLGWWRAARALGLCMKLLLVVSVGMYVLMPARGRTQEIYQAGALEGVFIQRNVAAFFAVAACLTFLIFATSERPRPTGDWSLAWAALSGIVVVLTRSSTGIAVCLSSGLLAVVFVAGRRLTASMRRLFLFLLISAGTGALWWAAGHVGTLSTLLGRDDTLTGRTIIWEVAVQTIAGAPWTGYGFGALWESGVPVTDTMWAAGGFRFYHAHNTYLDLLLQVGVPGLGLGLLLLAGLFWRSVRHFLVRGGPLGVWGLSITSFLALYALTEQAFLSHFGWTLLVLALAMTAATRDVGDAGAEPVAPSAPLDRRPAERHPGGLGSAAARCPGTGGAQLPARSTLPLRVSEPSRTTVTAVPSASQTRTRGHS